MTLAALGLTHDLPSVAARGFVYQTGPFRVQLRTAIPALVQLLGAFYGDCPATAAPEVAHLTVALERPRGPRRWFRPQAVFRLDDLYPFDPYPLAQAFPLLEWGLNWSIAMRAHHYLMLHAAVLERDDRALLLPALPGSGKSTLSAALAYRGWRFLSDEFGLIRPETGEVIPLPRAVPLKNRSIAIIRDYLPEAFLGPVFPGTRKGDVAHFRPPAESIRRQSQPARPAWILFPRFVAGLPRPVLERLDPSLGFTRLAHNAFNYQLLGETGFHTLVRLIRDCACYSLDYGDLDAAVAVIAQLPADDDR